MRLCLAFIALLMLTLCGVRAQSSAPFAIIPPNTPLNPYEQSIANQRKVADAFYARAQYTEAIAACKAGIDLATANNNPGDQAAFLWQIAYDYWLLGDLTTALEYAQRGLRIADEFPEDRRRSALLRVIGVVYHSMSDLVRAREYTSQALILAEHSNLDRERGNALTTLGNISLKQGDTAAARKNFEIAQSLFQRNGTARMQANALVNIADVEEAEHNLPKALATQEKVLAMRVASQDRRGQINSHRELARVLRLLNRLDEARAHLALARPLADEIGGHEVLAKLYEESVLVHEARGEFAEALKLQRLATAERDALSGERIRAHAAEIQARYELERHREAIGRLTLEKNVQSADLHARDLELQRDHAIRLVLYIAIGFILAVIIPLFFYRNRKHA